MANPDFDALYMRTDIPADSSRTLVTGPSMVEMWIGGTNSSVEVTANGFPLRDPADRWLRLLAPCSAITVAFEPRSGALTALRSFGDRLHRSPQSRALPGRPSRALGASP